MCKTSLTLKSENVSISVSPVSPYVFSWVMGFYLTTAPAGQHISRARGC